MALSRTFKCATDDLKRLLKQLEGLGATIDGDDRAGTLSGDTMVGRFEGAYRHDGETLTIEVTAKPTLIPAATVEAQMDNLIRRYSGS